MKIINLKSERGSTLIEFTLTILIFLIIFAAIVQFGYILFANNIVETASFEGARAGSITPDPADAESVASNAVDDYIVKVLPGWSSGNMKKDISITGLSPEDTITVSVSYDVPIMFGKALFPYSGGYFTVGGESTMTLTEKP
ncbi:MAG: pilus assembly protein [Actinobacteria bacterium]|nr:pilus assembly protein [Actinomycetota bacterium]